MTFYAVVVFTQAILLLSNDNFYVDLAFLVLYILEFTLKILGLGFWNFTDNSGYFQDPWNIFDFVFLVSDLVWQL